MKAAVLFSGGKDSVMALYRGIQNNDEILYLVSMISKNDESYMFHVPNIHMSELISQAIGIPIITKRTSGVKERELDDLKNTLMELKELGIEVIYSGALFSKYQKSRIDKICSEIGLISKAPLWNINEDTYMEEIIELGFEVLIIGVYAEGLDKTWLGKKIDSESLKELKKIEKINRINLAFEGGEAETLVINGPIFKKKIEILDSEIIWNKDSGFYNIKKAILKDKN
ncbi:MAG: TIGR00289 family protein [Methanobacteriaceae archaeon]